MERHLYCSDIDGALNRQGYYLADDTKALVNEIVDKDIWFTVATGRFLSRTLPIIEELNLKIPAICLGGALAYDNASKRIIKVWPILFPNFLPINTTRGMGTREKSVSFQLSTSMITRIPTRVKN